MKKTLTSEETLTRLMLILVNNLTELKDVQDLPDQEFEYGEKTAYIECLELLQDWEKANQLGLDYNIEVYFNFK